jgi:uncharacterized membrane protein YeaQ/YmgE (transglycosylase-associated protein family)
MWHGKPTIQPKEFPMTTTASLLLAQAPADQRGLFMSIVVWLFIGLVAGFLGSKIVNKTGEGAIRDIILGLIGAVVGGFLFSLIGYQGGGLGMTILVATIGAIVVLVLFHMIAGKPRSV